MKQMYSPRVAVIGLGRVALQLEDDPLRSKPCTHIGAWTASNASIIAGCDIEQSKCDNFRDRVPTAQTYSDYREMLSVEKPDFVSICAYATERKEMITTCIEYGVKGIWSEKAVATSLGESHEIELALKNGDAKLIVTYLRRWMPRYIQAKKLIANREIGTAQSITVHFSGNMIHTGTHAFDILRMMFGEVKSVQAWLTTPSQLSGDGHGRQVIQQSDDVGGYATLHFENGVIAAIHAHERAYFRFEIEVLGSHGMMRIGNTQEEIWRVTDSSHYSGFSEIEMHDFPSFHYKNPWVEACRNLQAAVDGIETPTCSVIDARLALKIAIAMHISNNEGNRIVDMKESFPSISVPSR